MAFSFITNDRFVEVESFALANPPTWTRLEPQSTAGDPRPGVEARVHDPLWLLGRQWQLGEFAGEDAGTPLSVRVALQSTPVDRWGSGVDGVSQSFGGNQHELLEPLVEREPVVVVSPGLRARAEAAAVLLASLDDAGLGAHRPSIVDNCPLDLDPLQHPDGAHAALDPHWLRLSRLLGAGGMADAESIALACEAAGGLPPWLVPAAGEGAALLAAIEEWLSWYRRDVSPPVGGDDGWTGERLEYRFRIGAGATVLAAPAHNGGDIEWYTFDPAPAARLADPDGAPPVAERTTRVVHTLLASPLRYAGMPADRLWEMEDARVNLGLIEAEPWDLARLLVAEFALTYGNDWVVAPIDVPFGSLTRIESVIYTTGFGEHFVVELTAQASPDGHWRMFTIAAADGAVADGLLVPPGAVAVQDGPAIEDVLFLRDEMANLAWAVERSVQGPSGAARDRGRERDTPAPPGRGPVASAALDYLLQTGLPGRWIPYLPRSSGYRAVDLVQGAMPAANGAAILPRGRILQRADIKVLKDAEIPREGVMVQRRPSMTRRADGSYLRWTTRRVSVGRGEGSSQLAFDSARPRKPKPNA
ncbi:MAG: hypothetical protein ABIT71_02600 [Vicinamibacteraceae bacterium]